MKLSRRFEEALVFAARTHAGQKRKGTEIPYLAHLLAVAAIVLENDGDEDEAIAALLHDAIEDQGGKGMYEEIKKRFGERVAELVRACSDAESTPKPPWRERKEKAVAKIARVPRSVLLIECADKLHNARAILADYRNLGEDLWKRFRGGREGTLWYYRAMADAFKAAFDSPLAAELDRVVTELERLAKIK